ncbi:hypothetical protein EMIHUDRAFT_225166 [Emiliania huxleyi CCMP1516]|uniref:SRPBCC domain-containing protein n=2 Tax=Emiliania huxleyi TaxID=2903 RepID=A0A0D3HYN0_EMIH1|nr:hypothetical protein EMIHUDRAFT_107961 [Emiliania huxleyi CCMP1516]XP_005790047.1 hypothetical protein EMIHUDRAFT_225166 [Emiliania huxleyi CCMP1516]EOD04115.1 hypothetical protein EMIHUDRAFT_107961 [Emiliania huxleyi CCMP1516]EOD37618.1 hypothetical protein EMIHUDRAFT_225166 [Emiliania huxleyi CCMP1516]|eukprot:XP_005756544.1 hypothetical protein EMIHUDRAFT_107961 [Emiliania huxleyi CCMP1516]
MVRTIRTEIIIDASIGSVWKVVSDLRTWGEWNAWTKFEDVDENPAGTDARLLASFDGDGTWKEYACQILAVDHDRHFLNWAGGVPCGLFHGNHWIILTPESETRTRMEHYEDFTGLLPALNLGMPFAKVARNYVYINEAVKRVVEARAPD